MVSCNDPRSIATLMKVSMMTVGFIGISSRAEASRSLDHLPWTKLKPDDNDKPHERTTPAENEKLLFVTFVEDTDTQHGGLGHGDELTPRKCWRCVVVGCGAGPRQSLSAIAITRAS